MHDQWLERWHGILSVFQADPWCRINNNAIILPHRHRISYVSKKKLSLEPFSYFGHN
jgi:hypothetical protein